MENDIHVSQLKAINEMAAFNRWSEIEVLSAGKGHAEIAIRWRDDFGQYAGFLHTALIGGLIDTACGYAAATMVGRVLASHFSVNCLRPGVGDRFIARARVVKPGKTQVFTSCEMHAVGYSGEVLVATGQALLVPVRESAA